MDYSQYLVGSPLVPVDLVVFLLIGLFWIGAFVFLILRFRYRELDRRQQFSRLAVILSLVVLMFLVVGSLASAFLFVPAPRVIEINPPLNEYIEANGRIEIVFDRPVSRKKLIKSIEPEIAGVWVYESSLYRTHLLRRLVFYPDSPLPSGKQLKIALREIENVSGFSKPYDYEFVLSTHRPQVVVMEGGGKSPRSLRIQPEKGETGVSVGESIRVEMEGEFEKSEVETSFRISPAVEGVGHWEGDSFVFQPARLLFETEYTVSVLGISSVFTTTSPVSKLSVPAWLQQHPLSCEVAALRMVLAYRGVERSEEQLLAEVGVDSTPHQGNIWGNPYKAFVGDVNGKQMSTGYGVYWGPIARVASNYRGAEAFEGASITKVTEEIARGNPVIVWVYSRNGTPTSWQTPAGENIYAVAGEHSVVVVGYVGLTSNPQQLIVNDPLIGQVYWSREWFENKWKVFNQSGVVVR